MKGNLPIPPPLFQAAASLLACFLCTPAVVAQPVDGAADEVKVEVKVVVDGQEINVKQAGRVDLQIVNGNLIVEGPNQPPMMRFFDIDPSSPQPPASQKLFFFTL